MTHCPRGHKYTPDSCHKPPGAGNRCLECARVRKEGQELPPLVSRQSRLSKHCRNGHEYPASPVVNSKGDRECRKCAYEAKARFMDKKSPEYQRNAMLKTTYGITLEDYNQMLRDQDGLCAICRNPPSGKQPWLHVDHDHETDQVRKLLCFSCNIGLGSFKDNPEFLEKAAGYLRNFK